MNAKFILSAALLIIFTSWGAWSTLQSSITPSSSLPTASPRFSTANPSPTPSTSPTPAPPAHSLQGGYQTFQTFNNCGPASLSMALSHFGINVTQQELGNILRPYQVASGDNDDKSVTLAELTRQAEEYGLAAYHRPAGTVELLERLVALDLPVITRTLTKTSEDIGHYRVVKGYDRLNQTLLQDDSLQGANLTYSYSEFRALWQAFNYEYLVLVPPTKVADVETILDTHLDESEAWNSAKDRAEQALRTNPQDLYARLNLSVAAYHLGDYPASVENYEAVADRLPFRALWYQLEPLYAYYETGQYQIILAKSQQILEGGNRAYSELYELRARTYRALGQPTLAEQELTLALRYRQPI